MHGNCFIAMRSGAAHLAWCRGRLPKNNVQTNAYDHVNRAFYLALKRSVVSSSPIAREPSPKCDQTKTRPSITGAGPAHVCCTGCAESLLTARASCSPERPKLERRRCGRCARCFADRTRKATSRRGRSDVAMSSGTADCGQESGHGKIDADYPFQTSAIRTQNADRPGSTSGVIFDSAATLLPVLRANMRGAIEKARLGVC